MARAERSQVGVCLSHSSARSRVAHMAISWRHFGMATIYKTYRISAGFVTPGERAWDRDNCATAMRFAPLTEAPVLNKLPRIRQGSRRAVVVQFGGARLKRAPQFPPNCTTTRRASDPWKHALRSRLSRDDLPSPGDVVPDDVAVQLAAGDEEHPALGGFRQPVGELHVFG